MRESFLFAGCCKPCTVDFKTALLTETSIIPVNSHKITAQQQHAADGATRRR
jgi:hypothetical protein